MTQELANRDVCLLPMNNKICPQGRKVHRTGRVGWIAAALIAVLALLSVATPAEAAWYNSSWQYRKKLTIDYTRVAATLSYFPVLVSLASDTDLAADAQDDGDDILFTSSNGTTKLDHEIEYFSGTTGQLVAWVKIPSLSNAADTEIYMYYGNGSATNQENATGVWDDGGSNYYKGVWHLGPSLSDSTSYGNDGTDNNGTTDAAGKIANARDFENYSTANNQYISVGHSASLSIPDYLTVEAWVRPESIGFWQSIVSKVRSETYLDLYLVLDTDTMYLAVYPLGDGDTGITVSAGSWQHVAFTYDGSYSRLYFNGSDAGSSGPDAQTLGLGSNTQSLYMGYNTLWPNELWDGMIDEVRISRTARSPQWMSTQFNNQNDPRPGLGTFFKNLGSEETNLEQEGFRFRADDGSESGATWLATQDTNISRDKNLNTRLRVLVNAATGDPPSTQYQLEYQKVGDLTWQKVDVAPSQTVTTITVTGAGTWQAPPNVTSVRVECWGGGGAGSRSSTDNTGRGGGGGGGYAVRTAMAVTPGTTYNYTVGAGGTDGIAPVNGGDTTFTGDGSVQCIGKGAASVAPNTQNGTAGATGSTGDTTYNGGAGGNGSTTFSGGGGEGACTTQNGNAASGITGGTGCDGGDGANGRSTAGIGAAGTQPGGGGAGGYRVPSTSRAGGVGGAGQIRLTYTPNPPILLSLSTYFADGDTTTPQLTPPSGKTESNFTAGKIQESSNPPAVGVDIGNNYYTELEWCLIATGTAQNGDVYQFRVTANGVPLTTYSVTPEWTIQANPANLDQIHYRWRNDNAGESANTIQVSATGDTTTGSATDVLVDSMTITPGTGDYHIWFSGSVECTATSLQYVSLYVNGVQLAHTERQIYTHPMIWGQSFPVATHARVTGVTAGQAIEVRWRTSASTATMHERTLMVTPIAAADSTQASATADTTTTSATDVLIDSMTITPGAGDYHIWFSGSAENTTTSSIYVSLYVNGVQLAHTERQIDEDSDIPNTSFPVATHARVTGVTAGQAIEVRWRTTAGIATMHERTLVVSKITAANSTQASATADTTTGSLTDVLVDSMTITPGAGDYRVWFSGSAENDAVQTFYVSLYVNGVQLAHTERQIDVDGQLAYTSFPVATHAYVTGVGDGQAIEVRWRKDSAGTLTMHQRTLLVEKVSASTWAANEDAKLIGLGKSTPKRIRFEVSNEGGASSGGVTYQLQVAQTSTCSSGAYSAVPDLAGHWQIVDSTYITDGEATSNIAGGLTDESTTFVAGQLKDAGNTTGSITLAADAFTEIEFAVQATTNAVDGANYCFRLYNTTGGIPLNTYSKYAEATIAGAAANLDQIHYRWRNDDGGESSATVAVDAASNNYTTGGSSITISHTVSGANRLMLVGVSIVNGALETVGLVTWKGTENLSPVGTVTNVDDSRVEIWSLVAPSTGTGNVVVSFGGAISQSAVAGVVTFTGVDQSTPLGTFASAIGDASSPATVNVSSAVGELVFGVVCAEYQAVTTDPSQTEYWNISIAGSGSTNGAGSTEAGAATVTTSWTLTPTSNHWAVGGVSIKPAGGGSGATWAANEDTKLTGLAKSTPRRVRLEVSNEGGLTSGGVTYQLQVAQTATCSSGTYSAVPTDTSGHWQIVGSTYITDGEATSNIASGLTDESTTFVAGQLKDAGNTTGSITLNADAFTEIEFAVQATTNATDGGNYCFRLYNTTGGIPLNTYSKYAEVTLAGGGGDTSPPTPNPMTWASPPANDSATQISMTSTTGSDATPPISYLFTNDNSSCGANAGTGGTSSSWQVSTSYSDSGLQANKCYGYTVTARDSLLNTGTASSISSTYTSANTPGTPTLSGATATTLNLTNAENGNPSSNPTTSFAVQVVTTTDATWLNQWVNASGYPSATEVWLTDAQLDALVLQGLTSSTTYGVKVKARNQDGDQTPLSAEGQGTTTSSGSLSLLYRSVGTNSGNLNTGDRTVTISGTTATFSGAMPNNIGVGDVLQYNSGGLRLAFIHGRASDTVYTVKSASGGNPQAAAAGTAVNVYRAYTSLFNWEAQDENDNINDTVENFDTSTNLVSANTIMNVACYGDEEDTTAVTIDGWTTGPDNYIKIFTPVSTSEVGTSQRHDGKWNTSAYRISMDGSYFAPIGIFERYVRIEGLQIDSNLEVAGQSNGIQVDDGNSDAPIEIHVSDSIFRMTAASPTTQAYGIGILNNFIGSNSNYVAKVWNNIIYGYTANSGTAGVCMYAQDNGTVYAYNNTCVGVSAAATSKGISVSNNVVFYAKNNISIDSADPYVGTFHGDSTNNVSDTGDAPGSNPVNGEPTFVSKAGNDYRLAGSDTVAQNAGAALSSDSYLAFSEDIGGESRPYGSAWDIGADEVPAPPLYRSVGTNAGNLNADSRTVTISGTTATFSDFMPNKIGVGDVLQYNSGGPRVAVIHGRTSSTVFTVMDKDGGTPTAAAAGTPVSVYRAYTSLANWQSQTQNANITADTINPNKDLVTFNTIMNVACYADGLDATGVTINGWATGTNNYINIFTPHLSSEVGVTQRHSGTWDATKYQLVAPVQYYGVIRIQDEYVRVTGLQIENTYSKASGQVIGIGNVPESATSEVRLSHNLLRHTGTGTVNYEDAAIYQENSGGVLKAWNNIMYNWGAGISSNWITGGSVILYNNTVVDSDLYGIYLQGAAAGNYRVANNLVQGTNTNYNFNDLQTPGLDYSATNLSQDATSPQVALRNKTVSFVDAANKDYHLAVGDTNAKDQGTNLSPDPNLAFSDDIDGQTRSSPWDIGADEYQFKPPTMLYRSVGTNAGNLNTAGRTVTISGTTATFNGSMPSNIGVGDVLQYQVAATYYVAFVHGRTSDTVYTVKSASGGDPQGAAAGTSVNVYRAYTSLFNWEAQDENDTINDAVENFDTSTDLVSAGTIMNVACYGDGVDTTQLVIKDWTTGASNYIRVFTPVASSEVGVTQRHAGKWDDAKYRISFAPPTQGGVIEVREEFVRIEGLQILELTTTNTNTDGIGVYCNDIATTSDIRISHNIVRAGGSLGADAWAIGVWSPSPGGNSPTTKIWNNIVYDFTCSTCAGIGVGYQSSPTAYVYSNTVFNCTYGYYADVGGTIVAKNNIAYGNSDNYVADGTFGAASTNNLSGPTQTDAPGSNARQGVTVTFIDPSGSPRDFRLSYADDSAQNYGTNLSSDSNLAFSDDINGHNRPFGSAWDIGADENAEAPYYRRVITLNVSQRGSSCTGSLSNFPVLIDTTNWPAADKNTLKTVSNGGHVNRSEGYDIIFRASDGVTQLDHEIEKYDGSTGQLLAWVRIPTLFENNRDTAIYIDYGNPLITSATANPAGVWDSNYKGVWHLADTSGNAKDSTSYNISGTVSGTVTRGATGQINGAFDCYTNGEVDWGDPADGHLDFGTGSFTVSAWLNIDAMVSAGAWPQPIWKGNSGTYWTGYALEYDDANNTYYFVIDDATSQFGYTSPGATFLDDTWYYIVGVVDRTNNRLRIYKNGVEVGTGTSIVGVGSVSNTSNLAMGADGGWGWFDGLIDEVRISNTARDACWIGTEYNSQNGPGSFTTVGSEIMLGQFENRKQITLNVSQRGSSCTGSLSNFPVLINLSGDWLKTKASGGSIYNTNGYDIIFRDANNNHLDHEIEKYDGSATPGNLIVWVRIPTLFENNQDTVIYMYYGNASISSPTENPTGVWDSNYRGVWHLKESGSGSLDEYKDSSQYANHGQGGKGYPLYVPTRVAGKVNYGQDFNNSDGKYNLIDLGNDPSLDVIGKQITLEAWVQHNASAERPYGILNHKGWNNGYSLWMQGNQYQCPSGARCVTFNLPGATDSLRTQTTLTGSTWHHVVGTYDGALMKVFIDGVQDSNTEPKTNDITAPPLPENDVWIGYGDQGMDVAWSAEWEGQIDEVRISSVARDTCWIQTQYNNQNSPSTFSNIGTGEEFEYKYRKQITILDSMTPAGCSSDLSNFPVLINLSGPWLKTVANSGNISHPYGYDIIFKAQDGETKLDHEIEKYDGSATGGTLVAWVRIPTLLRNANTIIYMYYGNPEVTSPTANKTGVWINNFREVWHLNETGGGTVADSTSSGYTGTASAGVNQNSATEKIDGADDFNGSTGFLSLSDGTLTANSAFTMEAWFRLRNLPADGGYAGIMTKNRDQADPIWDWVGMYAVNETGGGSTTVLTAGWGWERSQGGNLSGSTSLSTGQWYYGVLTYDGTNRKLYLGTNLEASDTGAFYNDNLIMNTRVANDSKDPAYFDGFIDEVRISTVARDTCWIGTSYNNQNLSSPGTYYTVEGQEDLTFSHRKQITLLNSMTPASCSGNLSNYPVHISLSGSWLKTVANGGDIYRAEGYDIIFRAQDGVTKLDHEIEKYDGTAGSLVAWVRIPTLLYNADTIIYMYYGNSTITTSQANPTGVWNEGGGNNYKAVWHLKESGNGTAGEFKDSTSNANHGQGGGGTSSRVPTLTASGKIGPAQDFNRANTQFISIPDTTSLQITGDLTLEAWVYGDSWNAWMTSVVTRQYGTGTGDSYGLWVGNPDDAYAWFSTGSVSGTADMSTGTWYHLAVSRTATASYIYVNGAQVGSTGATTINTDAQPVIIGGNENDGTTTPDELFDGKIDEVRIAAVARDACWIGTSYTNQSSPLASYTVEGEEFDYNYRKQITIKDSMTPAGCSSDLTNFPVLISLSTQPWLRTKVADPTNGCIENASGYDIIFKAEDGETKLDHEIEKYDGTAGAGTLVAWVRIPTLLRNADTIIYMYYGNPTVTSPTANPTAVWDSNSKAVYHLKETSGNQNDSTSNANHLTTVAVTNQGSATGKMDGADQFNGSTNYAQTNSTSAFDVAASNSMTVEAWINTSSSSGFVVNRKDTDGIPGWQLYVTGSGTIEFRFVDNSNNTALATSSGTVNNGQFHYVVGRWDGGSKTAEIFVDNLSPVSATNAAVGANTVTRFLAIGREGDDTPAYYFNGIIDEVRFSSTARSNCWIGTEYNNQNSQADIVVEGVGQNLDYDYRQLITISDSMTPASCSNNLTNFPVLVSLSGNWLKTVGNGGNIYRTEGYDITFRDENGLAKLDHEIEEYDGVNGKLVAWVRIPTLHFNDVTNIYIYYGNSAITSPTANAPGVWNNNYRGVWHLKENPGGPPPQMQDSTSNGNHGSSVSMSLPDQLAGKIDGSLNFDNLDNRINCQSAASLDNLENQGGGGLTASAWIYPRTSGPIDVIVAKSDDDPWDATGGWRLTMQYDDISHTTAWGFEKSYETQVLGASTLPGEITLNQWQHVTATWDGASSYSNLKLYLNGTLYTGSCWGCTNGAGNKISDANQNLLIGDTIYSMRTFDGQIDEVRVSNVVRDACWIGTEFNNQNSPTTYVTLGSEQVFAPTVVKLTSFKATRYPEGTLLEWKTGHEVDNLGFHVYREEKGQLVRLTPEPVAGSALLARSRVALRAGQHYSWWDTSAIADVQGSLTLKDRPLASRTVPQVAGLEGKESFASSEALLERSAPQAERSVIHYWLKDIDLNGTHTMHGPVTPVFSKEPLPNKFRPELLSELGMKLEERYHHYWKVRELKEKLRQKSSVIGNQSSGIRGASNLKAGGRSSNLQPLSRTPRSPSSKGDLLMQQFLASRPAMKLFVREEGWYQVSQPELVAAGFSPRVDPRYLQLFAEGREQPIGVIGGKDGRFGPGDAIEFYGVGLDTPSTDTRVYWLVEGFKPGRRVELSRSQGSRIVVSSFPYTVEKKDRWIYLPAIKNGEEENFFGAVVYGGRVDQVLEVRRLDRAATEDALLEVVLQGATEGSHRVKVYLNDEEVGEIVFEGPSRGFVSLPVSQSALEEGENLVSFIPQGGEMDVSLVDTIRLTYWHTCTADDNGLRLRARGGSGVSIDGFSQSDIRVFDITDSNEVIEVLGKVESQKGSYAVSFRVPGHGERTLLALSEGRVKNPVEIVSNHPSAWHQEKGGYGLIIISHRDFFSSLQPLKRLRESQGYRVALIDVEDLYDEFSFGHRSPHALRDFLSLAKKQWSKPPRFVLLVGDASFDPKNYFGLGDLDFVPTKLIDTQYLETASDDWFVDLNGDGLPEIAIGRLPVQTKEEAAVVVSKIVGYERSSKKREALLVSDINDGFDFEGASEELRGLLPSSLMVRKIYRGEFSSDEQAKTELVSGINQGPLLVNFIGHGSIEIWRGIFTSEDAEDLINKGLPFFVNMTCLNGYFQDPYSETMAESLMKAQSGGAIAVWTSSGLTEPDQQAVMNKELIKLLFGRESLTLGEATVRAKASVSDQDIRKTWVLFGDPTTRLK